MYNELWEILKIHLKRKETQFKDSKRKTENSKSLKNVKKTLKEQIDANLGDDDAGDDIDYRKIYKTIMCPLKENCSKVKMARWPSSGLSCTTKFGKECPYAHHPMELQFPETLKMRIASAKHTSSVPTGHFKSTGPLFDCGGCSRCNLCQYKIEADKMNKTLTEKGKMFANVNNEKISEKKKEQDKNIN